LSATFWLVFATFVGLVLAYKFGAPEFGPGAWLTFGRLRPIHTNDTFYGWPASPSSGPRTTSRHAAAAHAFSARTLALHWILNAYWEPLTFQIPASPAGYGHWRRCVDTSREPPQDICLGIEVPTVESAVLTVEARSYIVLLSNAPRV